MSPTARSPPPDGALELGKGAWIAPSKLVWSFSRSSGPGGQHVNKASTKATLRVSLGDIRGLDDGARERLRSIAASWLARGDDLVIQADESRSQMDNREAALRRLRAIVVQAATPPRVRRRTRPTRASKERRLASKKREGEKKARRNWRGE